MTATTVKQIHPYIEDLPIFEDKVDEIAESIDEVGLLHPVTLDQEGMVIGGRHRLAACEVAGIDPTFEVWEGDALAFMLHDNDARKHQTTGQLAAEKALTLDSAGKRTIDKAGNHRWAQGSTSLTDPSNSSNWSQRMKEAGTVLDVFGRDKVHEIASGDVALDAAYRDALSEKDRRERERREREEFEANQVKNEAGAELFFQDKPKAMAWYGEQPEGKFNSWLEAKTGYLAYDKELAWEEEKARREEERRQRDHLDSLKRDADRLKVFLGGYGQAWEMRNHPYRDHVLNMLDPAEKKRFITIEGEVEWPSTKH